ncbi:hypothetical protein [Bacteroides sp.]|uniref:hypothetical protein n=1 Tax=Bacteroides sp. TaxID=29523 RepID=UPI00262A2CB4|nr:hypothetical protein [Bacteroides sp.]
MKKKDMYVSPQIEVIEIENEGVIALSNYDPVPMNSARKTYSPSSATSNDLEDLINDILTVED